MPETGTVTGELPDEATGPVPSPTRNALGQWLPQCPSPNPAGRPKGSRNAARACDHAAPKLARHMIARSFKSDAVLCKTMDKILPLRNLPSQNAPHLDPAVAREEVPNMSRRQTPALTRAQKDERADAAKRIQTLDDLHYHRQGRKRLFRASMMSEAYKLGALGLTLEELAKFWNVGLRTLTVWMTRYPDFSSELKRGAEEADLTVINALLDQARAGNMTAAIFWLKNRQPHKWRDVYNHDLRGGETKIIVIRDAPVARPIDEAGPGHPDDAPSLSVSRN